MPTDEHLRGLAAMYALAPTNQIYEGLELTFADGAATIQTEVTPNLHHIGGALHGSHYFKLLDDAAYFAVNALVDDVYVLTAQFSVQLFRPIVAGRIQSVGRVTKPGRGLFYAESVLTGPDGKELARGHGSFAKSPHKLTDMPGYGAH